ncbi:hypothetical protein PMAYCL1PPCAC_07846 [Pristionchus mayeri]|uniref:Uncharacterized protein n=1 Tax=Pristionchus mayeri TaxID=1317129 RepID=A0AAN4ZBJ4_9BILA|nr:hypothetical protein PMAYCL1PPCAC_07846 [Pristionchus mayeri]
MPSLLRWWSAGSTAATDTAKEAAAIAAAAASVAASTAPASTVTVETQTMPLHKRMRQIIVNQSILAQFFKLIVLFVIALIHVFYARDFLNVFREMEMFIELALSRAPEAREIYRATFLLDLLVDYKKNLWMSVSAMCACLSSACFFLLLIREEAYKPYLLVLMRVIDAFLFFTLPVLLYARSMLVGAIIRHADDALVQASKQASPSHMMNTLHCSVTMRENVPLCSALIERAIFPVVLLQYLVVLCIITAAYVGLAYLIVYCIKHWFPHEKELFEKRPCHECAKACSCSQPDLRRLSNLRVPTLRPLVHPSYAPLPTSQA